MERSAKHAEEASGTEMSELATYKNALETTAADRDRLARELETYKHAFETTAADRDRLAHELETYERAVDLTTADIWSVADPLDAGHFRIDFTQFLAAPGRDTAALGGTWKELYDRKEYKELFDSIIARSGIRIAFPPSEDYLRPILDYLLASYFVKLTDFESALPFVNRLEFDASIDGADLLPYDIRQSSRLARYRQMEALKRDRPGIVIVGQMKSASAFLTHAISETFEVPVLRLSLGEGYHSLVVPQWARQISEGGAVTHEHIRAIEPNLNGLEKSGVGQIWVQIRDPRDTAFSAAKMSEEYASIKDSKAINPATPDAFVKNCSHMAQWIEGWVDAANAKRLKIGFITFEEVTRDLIGTMRRVCGRHFNEEEQRKAIEFERQHRMGRIDRRNFRRGQGGEWRDLYDRDVLDRASAAIPDSVRHVLDAVS